MEPAALRRAFLDVLLGSPTDDPAELVGATNRAPASGIGKGTWSERRFRSLDELVGWIGTHAEERETYVALARFRPGAGAKKAAVIAKACISPDVDTIRMPGPDHARQARQLAGSIPCPAVLVDSGGGFHPHLILPPRDRVEFFADPEDGIRHVEILGIALRLFLEDKAREMFGVAVELDHCHGAQRVWRVPPGWNLKSAPDARTLTADRAAWREVRLLNPGRAEGLRHIAPADLSFLIPFVKAAQEEREEGSAATLAPASPHSVGPGGSTVTVATKDAPYFDPGILPERLARCWPLRKGDQSEKDYAIAAALAEGGWSPRTAADAIRSRRVLLRNHEDRAKGARRDYLERTIRAAYGARLTRAPDPRVPPFESFPLECPPAPLGAYVKEGALALGCAPEAILVPLLCALGAVIGNTRRVQLKGTWTEPAVIWGAVILGSGKLKSPAQELALHHLRTRQGREIKAYRARRAAWQKEMLKYGLRLKEWKKDADPDSDPPAKPAPPTASRIVVSDTTLEALIPILEENLRGVLLARDELGGWLSSFDAYRKGRGGDVQQWLSIHRAGEIIVDRKQDRSILHVECAFVNVCGGIQPGTLRRILRPEFFECGLAARFLMTYPDTPRRRWTEKVVARRTMDAMQRVLDRLAALHFETGRDGEEIPVVMPFQQEAKALWIRRYNDFGGRQDDLPDEDALGAAFSKLEAYTARLALIFALVQWAAGRGKDAPHWVDAESMAAGIQAADWFCRETERVYAMLSESKEQAESRDLLGWIERRGGSATVRDLMRGPRKFRSNHTAAEAALRAAVQHGHGWWELQPPPEQGGHPTKVFVLRSATPTCGDSDARFDKGLSDAGSVERASPGGAVSPGQRTHEETGPTDGGADTPDDDQPDSRWLFGDAS